MLSRRLGVLLTTGALGLAAASFSEAAGSKTRAGAITPGSYRGSVSCTGSDRFSNGAATRHYRSSPAVSVVIAPGQRVKRWTYLFLGRHNLIIQSHAVRPGQSFTYAAGAHIGRPGHTTVTILGVVRRPGRVELLARLDWSSPQNHYVGSGTYDVRFERIGPRSIRYDAVKVVIKLPLTGPTAANPVVRRNEHCTGALRP